MRHNIWWALTLLALTIAAADARASDHLRRIDASLDRAARFLVARQDPDGAWRSGVHGSFRDGPSLTPHVLSTLYYLGRDGDDARESFRRGSKYLASLLDDGADPALHFPVYTAAEASWVTILEDRSAENVRAQNAWLAYLRARQLDSDL